MQGQSCSNHPGATVLFFFVFSLLPYLPNKVNFSQVFLPDRFFKSTDDIFFAFSEKSGTAGEVLMSQSDYFETSENYCDHT
jgi:hypothetical protein